MQEQKGDMSESASQAPKVPISSDISSILTQVQALQGDKERLLRELEAAKAENGHLKQGKREEMKKVFDTIITKWLQDSVQDEEARKQFAEGMERIVDNTKENGIWTVACAASNLHKTQLEEIERLRLENEGLKTASTSGFKDESSRKRGREESAPAANDFWGGFEIDMGRVQ